MGVGGVDGMSALSELMISREKANQGVSPENKLRALASGEPPPSTDAKASRHAVAAGESISETLYDKYGAAQIASKGEGISLYA